MNSVQVFAPATVGNAAVGFDILGFAVDGIGDRITVKKISEPKVVIESITGFPNTIPLEPAKNTAGCAVAAFIRERKLKHGYTISIKKGIPLSSGLGGSAASAVGAVVGANALLDHPLAKEDLIPYILEGEAVSSGSPHADNAVPCLMGGLTLILPTDPPSVVPIPVPDGISVVVVHPHLEIPTKEARAILRPDLHLKTHILQSANLAGFIAGCFKNDLKLLRQTLMDVLIEPQRSKLIPGFDAAKQAAMELGAIGFSISGSGSTVFAWSDSKQNAEQVKNAIVKAFLDHELSADAWVTSLCHEGARVEK